MPARIHAACTAPGCANPHYATGLCRAHYVSKRNAATRAASQPIARPAPVPAAPVPAPVADPRDLEAAQALAAARHCTVNIIPPAKAAPQPAVAWPTENAAAAFAASWADIEARRLAAVVTAPVILPPAPPMLPIIPPAPGVAVPAAPAPFAVPAAPSTK